MNVEINQLKDWLVGQRFKIGEQPIRNEMNKCEWYAWRRITLPVRECECNGQKLVFVVNPYLYDINGQLFGTIEVDITGEAGSVWWKLQAYSIEFEEFMERMPEIESALVNAWNALRQE